MLSALRLYQHLTSRYDFSIPFKTICTDYRIIALKRQLPDGVRAVSMHPGSLWILLVNSEFPRTERHAMAYHELYHILVGGIPTADRVLSNREETCADLFAALCSIPVVRYGDTADSLVERYGVPFHLAAIRIHFEIERYITWNSARL